MYEIRQKRKKEMLQNKWFNYALLILAIFLFSNGSSLIKTNTSYALPIVIISLIAHSRSVGECYKNLFNLNKSNTANLVMLIILIMVALLSFFKEINFLTIILLDIASIIIYLIISAIKSKKIKE